MISVTSIATSLAYWAGTHILSMLIGSGASSWKASREAAIQRDRLKWLEAIRAEEAAKNEKEPS